MESPLISIPLHFWEMCSHIPKRSDELLNDVFQKGVFESFKDEELKKHIKAAAWQALGGVYLGYSTYSFLATIVAGGISAIGGVALCILGLLTGYDLIKMGDNLYHEPITKKLDEISKLDASSVILEAEEAFLADRHWTERDIQVILKARYYLTLSENTLLINPVIRGLRYLTLKYDLINQVERAFKEKFGTA